MDNMIHNLPYDVLDDFFGEGLEVYLRNPWLTYGLPLHRFREIGFHSLPLLEVIDERPLSLPEIQDFCTLLFLGHNNGTLPDPTHDFNAFVNALSSIMHNESSPFCPVSRKVKPWIDIIMLNKIHGPKIHSIYPNTTTHNPTKQYQQQQQHHSFTPHHGTMAGNYQQPLFTARNPQQQQQQYSVPPKYNTSSQATPSSTYQQQNFQQQVPMQNNASSSNVPPHHNPHQSQPSAKTLPRAPTAPQNTTPSCSSEPPSPTVIKRSILREWALQAPNYQTLYPINILLGSIQRNFPPAYGVEEHDYFKAKWKPLSVDALSSTDASVIKRAVRKARIFLHPDKLPRDFKENQIFLCRQIWDVISDAWDRFGK